MMRKALTQQRLHEQRNAFGRRCAGTARGGCAALIPAACLWPACAERAPEHEGTRDHPGAEKRDRRGVDGALAAHGSHPSALAVFSAEGLPAHGSRDGVSQDFSAQGARVLLRRCRRGHVWLLSRLEAEAARVLPPCPECVREDAESVARHWARAARGGAS